MARTTIQLVVGIAAVLPILLNQADVDVTVGIAATAVGVSAFITRVMTLPAVETIIRTYVPWLAAEPPKVEEDPT